MIIDRKQFTINNKCVIEKLRIKAPFRYGAIFQDNACFLHIKDGEIILNSPTEKLSVHTSDTVLLKCGAYFADFIKNTKKHTCEVLAVHLQADILKEIFKDEIPNFIKPDNRKNFVQKIERQDIINHFIESIDFYFQNPGIVSDDLLRVKFKELILLLLQTKNSENIIDLFSQLFTPRQVSLKEVIQANLFSDFTVDELAILSARSLSTFKRDFETYFKDTPANYLKEQKLLRAGELLISTDFSINEICYQSGFSDNSHFIKSFKSKFGMTPSEYRKSEKSR